MQKHKMTPKGKLLFCVAIISVLGKSYGQYSATTVTKRELEGMIEETNFEAIRKVLKYEGVLAVTDLGDEYTDAVRELKTFAPECLTEMRYPEFLLPDGSLRTTFATESSYDEEVSGKYPSCLEAASLTISQHFDSVYQSLAKMFDLLTGEESLTWRNENGKVKEFADLPHKEHIHVYSQSTDADNYAAPFHTDNGILLLITPFQEHPLQVKSLNGQFIIDTSNVDNSAVLILIARGLPEWLLRGTREAKEFRAAPHAVESLGKDLLYRTVYARMMVAPLEAVPASDNVDKVPFSDVFFNQLRSQNDLCIPSQRDYEYLNHIPDDLTNQVNYKNITKRHADAYDNLKGDECSNPNQGFCWQGCMDIPTCGSQESAECSDRTGQACCSYDGQEDCLPHGGTCEWRCTSDPR